MYVLVYAAFAIEVVLLAYVVAAHFLERSALRAFVETAVQPERLKDMAKQLPAAYRGPATQFAGDLSRKGHLDDILTQAITKTANTPFGFTPAIRIVIAVLCAVLIFSPLTVAMMKTAKLISDTRAATQPLAGPFVFVLAKSTIDPAFESLRWAFESSALLLAGLIVVSALHWWLNRAEVREARFVLTLLEAAIIVRPGASAPISGRLSELIAPERGLRLPIWAFAFFFSAVTAGWALLYLTAAVKEANAADVYDVWPPRDRTDAVAPSPGLQIPVLKGGGSPVKAGKLATLTVGPFEARIGGRHLLARIENSQLSPPDWAQKAPAPLADELREFKNSLGKLELLVLADQRISMKVVTEILENLRTKYSATRADLIFGRSIAVPGGDGRPVQSRIVLDIARPDSPEGPWMRLSIDAAKITVDPDTTRAQYIDRTDPEWRRKVSTIVETALAKHINASSTGWIELLVRDNDLPYARFLEILGAADTTCKESDRDCGVPGIGLRFVLASKSAEL